MYVFDYYYDKHTTYSSKVYVTPGNPLVWYLYVELK